MYNMYLYHGPTANAPTFKFLNEYGVDCREIITTTTRGNTTGELTHEDMYRLLSKTEKGFEDVLAVRSKKYSKFTQDCLEGRMNVSEAVDFIVKDPRTLRSPIIEGDDFVVVGFNDDIRRLVPKAFRRKSLILDIARSKHLSWVNILG